MLNFLIFLYLQAFKISCSAELSMIFFKTSGPDVCSCKVTLISKCSGEKDVLLLAVRKLNTETCMCQATSGKGILISKPLC